MGLWVRCQILTWRRDVRSGSEPGAECHHHLVAAHTGQRGSWDQSVSLPSPSPVALHILSPGEEHGRCLCVGLCFRHPGWPGLLRSLGRACIWSVPCKPRQQVCHPTSRRARIPGVALGPGRGLCAWTRGPLDGPGMGSRNLWHGERGPQPELGPWSPTFPCALMGGGTPGADRGLQRTARSTRMSPKPQPVGGGPGLAGVGEWEPGARGVVQPLPIVRGQACGLSGRGAALTHPWAPLSPHSRGRPWGCWRSQPGDVLRYRQGCTWWRAAGSTRVRGSTLAPAAVMTSIPL